MAVDVAAAADVPACVVHRLDAQQVLVINILRRTDRRADMALMLNSVGVPVQYVEAIDGKAGMAEAMAEMGTPKRFAVKNRKPFVASCYASAVRALRLGIKLDRFPLLVLEDDADLSSPNRIHMARVDLEVPAFADVVVLANGGTLPEPDESGGWLVPGEPSAGRWGNAALLLPSAAAAARVLAFLEREWREEGVTHVDSALQRAFPRAGGKVFHAAPPLVGWGASDSDILGRRRAAKRPRDAVGAGSCARMADAAVAAKAHE